MGKLSFGFPQKKVRHELPGLMRSLFLATGFGASCRRLRHMATGRRLWRDPSVRGMGYLLCGYALCNVSKANWSIIPHKKTVLYALMGGIPTINLFMGGWWRCFTSINLIYISRLVEYLSRSPGMTSGISPSDSKCRKYPMWFTYHTCL